MKIYDISMPIHNSMLVWQGDPAVDIAQTATIQHNGVALSHLSLSSHTGTHIDAPSHFLENGATIDKIPLEKLIGPCRVLDLTNIDHEEILIFDIEKYAIQKNDRILFKTGNFTLLKQSTFPKSYVSLSLEAATYLAEKEITLVGTDFLGIEKKSSPGHPVHKMLLSHNIVNVEGLNLENVPEGEYELYCLPLNIVECDGAPARVILSKS